MKLYSYFRSSTAYRVRIGLHLKGIAFETAPVNIFKGEHRSEAFLKLNPAAGVPALAHDGHVIGQSLAILNYIDNLAPEPPLVTGSFYDQAFARQVALTIATDIHPAINMKVMNYLKTEFGADGAATQKWYERWVGEGLGAVETMLRGYGGKGPFAMGDAPGLIDLCVVPQMYSARRFNMDLSAFPICRRIEGAAMKHPAFLKACPEVQPDAPADLVPIHGIDFKC